MNYKSTRSVPPSLSEVTPEELYLSRRNFLKAAGTVGASLILAACGLKGGVPEDPSPAGASSPSGDEALTPYETITHYNNFYEFTTDKEHVATLAEDFITSPWAVEVGGLVKNPKIYSIEDLIAQFTQEERIYRLRCVEGWSMVIPWLGFELAALLREVEPSAEARYVRFESAADASQMPGLKSPFYPWPYTEGLRLDEAMHPLTILATGLYGKPLPPQDGAPIRLVVPWKYGFKSIKSIVKIELLAEQPATLWNQVAPDEYGFYANVNPQVDHPRWSQATERRIGEASRRRTLIFNGYADEVAKLYEGLDLEANY